MDPASLVSRGGAPRGTRPAGLDPDGLIYCVICQRKAKGYGFCFRLQWQDYPYYQFCSKRCQDIGFLRANQGNTGMIEKTARERRAIQAARKNLADVLTSMDLMKPFFNRTPDEIDLIIEACIDGFQRSMVSQKNDPDEFSDEIPF